MAKSKIATTFFYNILTHQFHRFPARGRKAAAGMRCRHILLCV